MCVGFEGVLIAAEGFGITRTGVVLVADREYTIGLACVPDARLGDQLIAHSGQAVRVVTLRGDAGSEGPSATCRW